MPRNLPSLSTLFAVASSAPPRTNSWIRRTRLSKHRLIANSQNSTATVRSPSVSPLSKGSDQLKRGTRQGRILQSSQRHHGARTWSAHSSSSSPLPAQAENSSSVTAVEEWTFDGEAMISSEPSPSIAYIAFYSDVEHEVLKVTSGHRVTITYNLYLLTLPVEMQEPSVPISRDVAGLTNFKEAPKIALQGKDFLREGGTLGFGIPSPTEPRRRTYRTDSREATHTSGTYVRTSA